jgi:hypothetical protein
MNRLLCFQNVVGNLTEPSLVVEAAFGNFLHNIYFSIKESVNCAFVFTLSLHFYNLTFVDFVFALCKIDLSKELSLFSSFRAIEYRVSRW